MKLFLCLMLLTNITFAQDLEQKTELLDMTMEPLSYLAMTGKEKCKDKYEAVQLRADRICQSHYMLGAAETKFTTAPTVNSLEYLMVAMKYDFKRIEPKIYKCRKARRHAMYLPMYKFVKILCLKL